jgi:hypothetical protein
LSGVIRRRGLLLTVVGALVVALAVTLPGLARTGEATRSREHARAELLPSANPTGSSLPPEAPRVIPSAFLQLGSRPYLPRQQGKLLASHWLAKDGSVVDTVPDGTKVVWPRALKVSDPTMQQVWLRLETPQNPIGVELRVFDGRLDSLGVPRDAGRLLSCLQGPAANPGCSWSVSGGGVDVLLFEPLSRPSMLLVLYAEWLASPAARSPPAPSHRIVNASWGFRLAVGRLDRNSP